MDDHKKEFSDIVQMIFTTMFCALMIWLFLVIMVVGTVWAIDFITGRT